MVSHQRVQGWDAEMQLEPMKPTAHGAAPEASTALGPKSSYAFLNSGLLRTRYTSWSFWNLCLACSSPEFLSGWSASASLR